MTRERLLLEPAERPRERGPELRDRDRLELGPDELLRELDSVPDEPLPLLPATSCSDGAWAGTAAVIVGDVGEAA